MSKRQRYYYCSGDKIKEFMELVENNNQPQGALATYCSPHLLD